MAIALSAPISAWRRVRDCVCVGNIGSAGGVAIACCYQRAYQRLGNASLLALACGHGYCYQRAYQRAYQRTSWWVLRAMRGMLRAALRSLVAISAHVLTTCGSCV